MSYEVHPAAALFPLMDHDQFRSLVEDIRENGLAEPIVLFEKKILDGRNRLRACEVAGVEPRFHTVRDVDPEQFVISRNLHRRHLTIAQRSAIAMELLPQISAEAKKRVLGGKRKLPPELEALKGGSAEKLAEMFGVGRSSIEKTIAIQKTKPEVVTQMRSGEIRTVDGAMRAAGINKDKRPYLRSKPYGDAFYEVVPPILKYLKIWAQQEHKHINPKEAAKRLDQVQQMQAMLDLFEEELERRATKARTTV